jgi:phage/plasmid-like protein (TIGR03299 family)
MAHNIFSTDAVALAERGAWHGLGTIVARVMTWEEAQSIAFPWEPEERGMFLHDGTPCPDRKAIHRTDSGAYLGSVGADYGLVTNGELGRIISEALPGAAFETAGSLFGGRRVWALARIGTFDPAPNGHSDENRQYLMIANGHDGRFRVFFGQTSVRVVCWNTLSASISGGEVQSFRHTKNVVSIVTQAARALRKAREIAEQRAEEAQRLARTPLTTAGARDYFEAIFPAPQEKTSKRTTAPAADGANVLDMILSGQTQRADIVGDLLAADMKTTERAARAHERLLSSILDIYHGERNADTYGENAWTAYQAISEYVDHERSTRGQDDTDRKDNRFASVIWGSGQELKSQAYSAALQLAQ